MALSDPDDSSPPSSPPSLVTVYDSEEENLPPASIITLPPASILTMSVKRAIQRARSLFLNGRRPLSAMATFAHLQHSALDLAETISSLTGGEAHVQLVEDHYIFVMDAPLRTFVLRISGLVSGQVAQIVLPANSSVLALLPMQPFIRWVRAFERGDFGVPDYVTPAQRELLVDFARMWEIFVCDPCVGRAWEVFSAVLRSLVTDAETFDGHEDGGFAQLAVLSDWARSHFPNYFCEVTEADADSEMPELQSMYGSSSGDEDA